MNTKREIDLPDILSFEWDDGNVTKSTEKHGVIPAESEQVFHNNPVYAYDKGHSQAEERYFAYGVTDTGRSLVVVFTIRKEKIRVISARRQSKKERRLYEKVKTNSAI